MVSINTNISALISQANLNRADGSTTSSIAKLSSGNRIVRAADDAAGLAVGTGLRTDVSTLRTALTNTSQAVSVLSLADGALANIGEILQRQKALAVQANSGSLSSAERVFLNQEFQNLTQEIDRISGTTNFNGINLIDGSIASDSGVTTDTTGSEAKFTASVTMATAPADADSATVLTINGITFSVTDTEASNVNNSATDISIVIDAASGINGIDTTTGTGLAAAVAYIINNIDNISLGVTNQAKIDALKGLSATSSGAVLTVTSKNSGVAGMFELSKEAATDVVASITSGSVTVGGATTALTSVAVNTTDTSGSLGDGSVTASGTVGENVLTALATTAATLTHTFGGAGDLDDTHAIIVMGRTFTFRDTVTDAATQIQTGTTDRETLTNLVKFLNASVDPTISRFTFEANSESALSMVVTAKTNSAKFAVNGLGIDDQDSALTALTAGAAGGVDVSTITDNDAFVGTIGGFTATYTGSDAVTLSVKIGDYTYQGKVADTTPGANTSVRLYSTDSQGRGGYFTIQLGNGTGTSVSNQTNADTYVARINTAFSSLEFQQTRAINSFTTDGTVLEGGKLYLKASDFSDLTVTDVSVRQATSTNSNEGSISITLADGRVFEDTTLGRKIHAGEKIELVNRDNSNEKIIIIGGTRTINLDNATDVASLREGLVEGFSSGTGGLNFQVGIDFDDSIAVALDSATTADLFGGVSLNILDVNAAAVASALLDDAIDQISSLRASIGSLQSRFDFAAANLETSIQNTDAARADFLDADIAEVSSEFAKSQVLVQASISVLAQANQLPQNLLKLIA